MSPENQPVKTHKPSTPITFSIEDRMTYGAFTIAEFCKLTGVSRPTFHRHRAEGLITTTKRGGKVFILGAELRRYLEGSDEK